MEILEFNIDNNSFDKSLIKLSNIDGVQDSFILDNVLSEQECDLIIESVFNGEHHNSLTSQPVLFRGWSENPDDEYKKIGKRVIRTSKSISKILSHRIESFIVKNKSTSNLNGKQINWGYTGLSHRHRFISYEQGQVFPTHMDGSYNKSDNESSFLTCLFFLNSSGSDYSGGVLEFLTEENEQPDQSKPSYEVSVISRVEPKKGRVVIFPHKILHQSSQITNGTKYLIRNDIMFEIIP
ncbi:hypothetical protein CYY_003742 [Polysphondylium violaceum]|uniref:Fe2OG dioxygenase domain-containing protein n=1 Tax=Polysphondylium violaceum TaxID=133409 RepID=A0A8J4V5R0_9MYCE|nr:hypothetical protein CYY_003742 [Polysphondylium violaceum]